MSNLFSIGTSALLTAQRQLATTSHNIANVATEGYSRQSVETAARVTDDQGGFSFGAGVDVANVSRSYDQYLTQQLRGYTSAQSELDTLFVVGDQIQSMLASDSVGIGPSIDSFFNAVQTVADDPTSIAARQVLLSEGEALTDRFKGVDDFLTSLEESTNNEIAATVTNINSLAEDIASVNASLLRSFQSSGEANDLLDRRDQLLKELSSLVDTKAIEDPSGSVNVLVGTGQTLVVGNQSFELSPVGNQFDAARIDVGMRSGGFTTNITSEITGGKLGGLIRSRDEVIDHTRNSLGRLAATITDTMNTQHHLGADLFGTLGGDLFGVIGPEVVPDPDNPVDAKELSATLQPQNSRTGVFNSQPSVLSLTSATGSGTAGDQYSVDVDGHTLTVTADGTTALAQLLHTQASAQLGGYGYSISPLSGSSFDLSKSDGTDISLSNFQNLAGSGGSVTAAAVSGGALGSTTLTNDGDSATLNADATQALLSFNDALTASEVVTLDVDGNTVSFNAGADRVATASAFASAASITGMSVVNNGDGTVTLQKSAGGNSDISNAGLTAITISNLTASSPGTASVAVSAGAGSSGTATVLTDSTITDLTTSDYMVVVDASGDHILQRLEDDFRVNLGANPTGGSLLSVDGIDFAVSTSGSTRPGDTYLIKPTAAAGQSLELKITDPSRLAAASPVRVSANSGNGGGLAVGELTVSDTSVALFASGQTLSPEITVQFNSATSYDILRTSDGLPLASGLTFQQGSDLLGVNGLNLGIGLTFDGVPTAGDSFAIEYNSGGVGNNQNALALGRVLDQLSLEGGTANIQEGYRQLIGEVGKMTRAAELGGEAQAALVAQTELQQSSTSGVNLDEEAADLLRFQQSYQAAAQVIRTANELFDTLLSSLG